MNFDDHAQLVQAHWDYSCPETLPYFQYLLSDKCLLPNSAVFDAETNVLVAHVLYSGDGAIGAGWVHPEYRGRGLYQVVIYDLCQKIFAMGQKVAWAYVSADNDASTQAFRSIGGEECDYRVDWIESFPLVNNCITSNRIICQQSTIENTNGFEP